MHGRSIDNIDNVNVRPWDTFILPRTFLDLLYDIVAVPHSILIKRVLLREKSMENLEKLVTPVYTLCCLGIDSPYFCQHRVY